MVDGWFQKIAGVGLHRFNSYMNVVTLRGLSSTGYAQRDSNATSESDSMAHDAVVLTGIISQWSVGSARASL